MAKLSNTEKYAIQGMLHNNKTSKEIAVLLKRSEKSIDNYIAGELDRIQSTIAQVQIAQVPPEVEVQSPIPKVDLTKIKKLPKGHGMRTMGLKTAGDKPGVAVMTPAASQVGDEFRKEMGQHTSRTAKGNLYDAAGNKKEE